MIICVFGDSITWGACDFEKGGWAERLKTYFMAGDRDVDLYNLGISNDDTQGLLKRFDAEAVIRKPDIIIFAIGINDASFLGTADTPRIALEAFRGNVAELVKKAGVFTTKIICVGLTRVEEEKTLPLPYSPDQYYRNERIAAYDKEIELLCKKENISYVGIADIVTMQDLDDGLHPNAGGHEKIFQAMRDIINKVLLSNWLSKNKVVDCAQKGRSYGTETSPRDIAQGHPRPL
jgi:lysophospholipase L1-like esterase